MNYPAIKQGDLISYTRHGIDCKTTVEIQYDGEIYIDNSDWGYQDDPQLMMHGVTNFRIIERADGTPVFMEGDTVIDQYGGERKVLAVNNDSFLCSFSNNEDIVFDWLTFKEAHNDGWKLKAEPEPEAKEVTMEEVCAKFGESVKIKKG